jgi:methyl-accepting chemotaxis protein
MLKDAKIATKMLVGFAVAILIAIAIGMVGRQSLQRTGTLMHDIADNRMPSTSGVQEMVSGMNLVAAGQRGLAIRRMLDPKSRQENFDAIATGLRKLAEGRRIYEALPQDPGEARIWQRLVPILDDWQRRVQGVVDAEHQKDALLATGAKPGDSQFDQADERAFQALLQSRDSRVESERLLDEVIQINLGLAKTARDAAAATVDSSSSLILTVLLLGLGIVAAAAWAIMRGVGAALAGLSTETQRLADAAVNGQLAARGDVSTVPAEFRPIIQGVNDTLDAVINPLNVAAHYVEKISQGEIPDKITSAYNGDFNTIKNNLNVLVDTLNGFIEAMGTMSREHDAGDIDVFVPEDRFRGSYRTMAKGVNDMVKGHISVKKKAMACIAQFAAGNFDAALERFPGKKAFINENIEHLRSNCKTLVEDSRLLSQAAVDGKLATRADASKHQGDFRKIVQGVNDTLDAVIGPLNVAATYVEKISQGDIPSKISTVYNGDFNTIKNNLNLLIETLNGFIESMTIMSQQHDAGDIDVVVPEDRFRGSYRFMAKGVNDMVNGHIAVKKKAMACIAQFAAGNFDAPLERFPGKKAFINENVELLRKNSKALIEDANKLSQAAVEGKLSTRADATKHQGDFRKIVQGVNDTLDSVIGPLNVAADYVDKISLGNIPKKITDNYNGDFNTIKNNLNRCIDAVNEMVADAQALSHAAIEGRLATRADATKHLGDFRKIVEGVNKTLDAVINPVMEATQVLESLSKYDLRVRVMGDYSGDHARIKTALNGTAKALHDALSQVADAVEQVSEASRQIASSSQSVAQGASQQASSLEETSSSLEEMSGMTKQNADNTIQARSLAQSTKEAAEKGGMAMGRMIDAMEKIRAASEGTSQIIKDINDIAFQTNLLALNAAVEAARAGDAGRGFAVVAEEVRSLALRSKEAAKKTEDLIKMSVGHAENGRVISGEVAGSLTEIVTAAGKVNEIVSEIAVASQEQSRGIEQVNTAVSEMDKVVQVAAANAEESSSAAEELSSQSEELTSLVGRFQLERDGSRRVERRDATSADLRRRTTVSVPVRRAPANPVARARATNGNGSNGSRKPSAEEAIPFDNDPEFKDF